jgi:enoyl-CoA hydratase/carnithine racemase
MDRTQFGGDRANRERIVSTSTAAMRAVSSCPRPVVAAVHGAALAGGFALALLCDLIVAAESARFGFVEVGLGIPAAYAAARAVLPAPLARELALTGRVIDAREAHARGVVTEVVPDELLPDRALELASAIAQVPRAASVHAKRRIMLEREAVWGALFAEEEEALRRALLGDA